MYARQIWPDGCARYNDVLRMVESYFDKASKHMIAYDVCHAIVAPACAFTVAQMEWLVQRRVVLLPGHFQHACMRGDVAAMEWLYLRGLYAHVDRLTLKHTVIDWLHAKRLHLYGSCASMEDCDPPCMHSAVYNPWMLQFLCEQDDPVTELKKYPRDLQIKIAGFCHFCNNTPLVKYCYEEFGHLFDKKTVYAQCTNPELCHYVASVRPVKFNNAAHRIHTATARMMKLDNCEYLCKHLTWDDSAREFMDSIIGDRTKWTMTKFKPRCMRAVEWCRGWDLTYDFARMIRWVEPNAITYQMARALRNTMDRWLLSQLCNSPAKLRAIHRYVKLPLERCYILLLCAHAPGDVILQYVVGFTRSHLMTSLQHGNLQALHYMVGIACAQGWEYCVRYIRHAHTWVWLRENVPMPRLRYSAPIELYVKPGYELKLALARDGVCLVCAV